jgi:hypothetical protein
VLGGKDKMGELEIFLDDALPALLAGTKGKMYSSGSEIYRINDFGQEYRGLNNKRTGMAHVEVLWLGRPLSFSGWFTSSRFELEDIYGDRKATQAEIRLFEAAEKRKKVGKLETDADMKELLVELMPERLAEGDGGRR